MLKYWLYWIENNRIYAFLFLSWLSNNKSATPKLYEGRERCFTWRVTGELRQALKDAKHMD